MRKIARVALARRLAVIAHAVLRERILFEAWDELECRCERDPLELTRWRCSSRNAGTDDLPRRGLDCQASLRVNATSGLVRPGTAPPAFRPAGAD